MARKAKPWRVRARGSAPAEDYSSQKAAYEAVTELTGWGHTVSVWHWSEDSWHLHERIEPEAATGEQQ